ncbi:MAG: hypothetical protein H0V29_12475 [Thermoleophilaceae bacterium]|nr:hypothetical protein [Thermoleophilaceae bacterium]
MPLQITGVITDRSVTISPDGFGAGPVVITIANETKDSHTLTLEGPRVSERVGPINPADTAAIQKTLPEGEYTVTTATANDEGDIDPGKIKVGPERESGSGELLLP